MENYSFKTCSITEILVFIPKISTAEGIWIISGLVHPKGISGGMEVWRNL
jgi:hypothetical protein